MRQKVKDLLFPETHLKQVTTTNMSHLFNVALLLIPISVIHFVIFAFFVNPQNLAEVNWRNGLIIAHSLLVVFASMLSFAVFVLENYEFDRIPLKIATQIIAVLIIMFIGVGIVSVDQYVTSSISTFIIFLMVTSVVILMPPLLSGLIYTFVYIIFFIAMGFMIQNPIILLSNRFNGFTALIMAIALSNILWFYFTNYENHKNKIQEQNRSLEQQKLELEQLNYRLGIIASVDSMTQLLNRREFEIQANTKIELFREHGVISSLMIADIDHFKVINDKYGHLVGDELFKQFSDLLKTVLRENDIIARWGGDEFAVMIHDSNLNASYHIAERLRLKIEKTVFHIHSHEIRVTASFGIAPFNLSDEEPLYTSYLKADKALYRAKDNGRNNTIIYMPQDHHHDVVT